MPASQANSFARGRGRGPAAVTVPADWAEVTVPADGPAPAGTATAPAAGTATGPAAGTGAAAGEAELRRYAPFAARIPIATVPARPSSTYPISAQSGSEPGIRISA